MRKPEGYLQSAIEAGFGLLVLSLPYYKSLLYAEFGHTLCALFLTCLLLFLVVRVADLTRIIAAALGIHLAASFIPAPAQSLCRLVLSTLSIPPAPVLHPLFQRPPPLFS